MVIGDDIMVSVEKTKNFYRIRVRDPQLFVAGTFRTQDIGRDITKKVDYSGRIAGILKTTGKYATQSYLVSRYSPDGRLRDNEEVMRDVNYFVEMANAELMREKKKKGWFGESLRHSLAVRKGKGKR